MIKTLGGVALLAVLAAPAMANGQEKAAAFAGKPGPILERVPDRPDPKARYLIYLHGRIVEDGGGSRRPTHPERGVYEYDAILGALASSGAIVISEQRPARTDVVAFARHVITDQVQRLLRAGVPPERITVAGFSKGGGIAIQVSNLLKDPRVNFVFMGACGSGDFDGSDIKVQGRILSIYEETDEIGQSCAGLFAKGGPGQRSEVEVKLGDRHGTFYRVRSEWLDPLLRWVDTAPQPASPASKPAGS